MSLVLQSQQSATRACGPVAIVLTLSIVDRHIAISHPSERGIQPFEPTVNAGPRSIISYWREEGRRCPQAGQLDSHPVNGLRVTCDGRPVIAFDRLQAT